MLKATILPWRASMVTAPGTCPLCTCRSMYASSRSSRSAERPTLAGAIDAKSGGCPAQSAALASSHASAAAHPAPLRARLRLLSRPAALIMSSTVASPDASFSIGCEPHFQHLRRRREIQAIVGLVAVPNALEHPALTIV